MTTAGLRVLGLALLAVLLPLAGGVAGNPPPAGPGGSPTVGLGATSLPAGPGGSPTVGLGVTAPPVGATLADLLRRGLRDRLGRAYASAPADLQPAYPVGQRWLRWARGRDRPLLTSVWYPAAGAIRAGSRRPAGAAAGRFPLVLLSHGLRGRPARLSALATRWAAAGFVVAAPAYPYTSAWAAPFRRADLGRQPADAVHVIARLSRLDTTPGDPLAGHLHVDRVAAVGHSAGAHTTAALFAPGHRPALRAGVLIAGWAGRVSFGGPPARLLFVHGSADRKVPPARAWAAYRRVPWPKAMLTLPRQRHAGFLRPGGRAFGTVEGYVTDFLRWTLNDDPAARARLPARVPLPGSPWLDTALHW